MPTVTQEAAYTVSAVFDSNDAKVAEAISVMLPPTSAATLPDNQFYVKKITLKIDSSRPTNVLIPRFKSKDWRDEPEFPSGTKVANTGITRDSTTTISRAYRNTTRLSLMPTISVVNETTLSGTTIVSELTGLTRPEYPSDKRRDDSFALDAADKLTMLKYYQYEATLGHDIFTVYSASAKDHYILFDIFHNKLAANAEVQISMIQDSFDNPTTMTAVPIKEYAWQVVEQTVTKISLLVKIGSYSKTNFNSLTLSVLLMGNQINV